MNGFQKFLLKIVCLIYPCKFFGAENIPDGRAVIVCNHFRFVDPIFLIKANNFDKDLLILGKKELFKNKLFSKILKSFNAVPINRESPDLNSILTVTRALKNNKKVAIFPEGTRNKKGKGEPLKLKGGSAVFAIRTKSPIVPIVMLKKAKIFRKTLLLIGEPFYLENYYDKKLDQNDISEIDEIVRNKLIELQNKLSNTK